MNNLLASQLFQRFWQIAGAVSIRVKVLGIVLSVIFLLGVFVTLQMRSVLTETLERRLLDQGEDLAGQFAEDVALFIQNEAFVEARAYLIGRQEHYSSAGHNTAILYIWVEGSAQQISTWNDGTPYSNDTGIAVDIVVPVRETSAVLHLGVADITIDRTVREVTFQLLMITLVMIAVGFGGAFFLTWILTRPIYELVEATQSVARGDYSRRVTQWADDEIGELAIAFNGMTEALAQAEIEREERDQLRTQFVSKVIAAQEEERKRIARELHDSTGQSLTSLLVGLHNLKDAEEQALVPARIDALRDIVSQTLDEVRQMAWQLRPSTLDDLGLVSAIQRYIDDYQQRFDVQVDFIARDVDERLPVEMETVIYRVIQEALTNIVRHAQASSASVIIDRRANTLRIIVEDNGIGFALTDKQDGKSLGLQGIRERAALFNGTLIIETEPGQGTSLFLEIPFDSRKMNGNKEHE